MALITFGTLTTAGWAAWKYWRIPYRLYLWRKAEETEPATGQVWLEAGFSPKDSKWKIKEVEELSILLESVPPKDGDDTVELDLVWDDWSAMVKKTRLFCHDKNDSIHDQYWGAGVDD